MVLVEIGARILTDPPRYHALNHLEFEPELGFRQVPDLELEYADARGPFRVHLSSEGFRGRAIPEPGEPRPGPEITRVAFIGDSFLVGLAVRDEQLLTSRTEQALVDDGHLAEVYNLSSTDYGTGQELLLLRRFGARIRPDVVVLALYPSNDLPNNAIELAGRTTGSPGDYLRPYLSFAGDEVPSLAYVDPTRAWVRRHSRLFAILERGWLGWGGAHGHDPWPARPGPEQRLRAGLAPSEELEIHRAVADDPAWEAAWQTTFGLIRALRGECDSLGARFAVLVIPRFVQVQRDATSLYTDWIVRQAGARSLDEQLDWNEPETRLARFFRDEGIDARIALDAFRAATAGDGASVYLSDGHLDPRGHEVAAREVVDWLRRGGSSGPPTSPEPISLLPDAADAPARLDFRSGRHEPFLVLGGWPVYRSLAPAGWMVGARARLALPARSADLIVRGRIPAGRALPLRIRVGLEGGDGRVVSVERSGPFEIRLPHPVAPSLRGYLFVDLETAPASPDLRVPAGPLIEEVGFEEGR